MNTIVDDPNQDLTARIFHVLCHVAEIEIRKPGTCCVKCSERATGMYLIAATVADGIQLLKRKSEHLDPKGEEK
jgi:hypothetical protein